MSAIFISIGPISIYWYSIILLVAFLIGAFLAIKEVEKFNISKDKMYNMFFYLVPIVLIGARVYFVLFHLDYYLNDILGIFKVWEGGLAIHGGIIAGILFVSLYTKKNHMKTLKIIDIMVVSLILGQAIGRWGNFFNGEAHGPITTLAYLKSLHLPHFIIEGMYLQGDYYHPTFLYESIWCFVGFIILILIRRKLRIGQITSIYLIWYGIGRFAIESLRTDSLMLSSIKVAQLVSIFMILSGIILFYIQRKEKKYNEGNVYGKKI